MILDSLCSSLDFYGSSERLCVRQKRRKLAEQVEADFGDVSKDGTTSGAQQGLKRVKKGPKTVNDPVRIVWE